MRSHALLYTTAGLLLCLVLVMRFVLLIQAF
jgi:hypothetical protein